MVLPLRPSFDKVKRVRSTVGLNIAFLDVELRIRFKAKVNYADVVCQSTG